jgi:hypothetical protein
LNQVVVSTWVKLSGGCNIEYSVIGDQVEFTVGQRDSGFEFVATEEGLEELVEATTAALRDYRAGVDDDT